MQLDTKKLKPLIFLLFLSFASLSAPSPVHAQDDESPLILRITAGAFIFSLLSTSTYVTVVRQAQLRKNEQMEEEIKELETLVFLDTYLQHNTIALRQDLALGSDDALRDLAHIMAIPTEHYASWRAHMISQRELLDEADTHTLYHAFMLPDEHATSCALSANLSPAKEPLP